VSDFNEENRPGGSLSGQLTLDHLQEQPGADDREQAVKWFGIMPKEGQWENTLSYDHPSIFPLSVSVFGISAFTKNLHFSDS
jgi:hypothetical protein